MNAFAVVSDSGTLPEESSFFTSVGHPFPAVCIRTSTERPEAMDKGCFVLSGIDERGLLQAVEVAAERTRLEITAFLYRTMQTRMFRIRLSKLSRATLELSIKWCGGSRKESTQ